MSDTTHPQDLKGERLRTAVFTERAARQMSLRKLLAALELEGQVDPSTLNRWLNGETIERAALVEEAARRWLTSLQTPKHRRASTPFVETRLSEKVMSALAWAKTYSEMVAIIGEPGLGKTRSILRTRELYEDVWVATIDPASGALVPALQALAHAVGATGTGGASAISSEIQDRVDGRQGLLIIDEAQHLGLPALDQVRAIHDATDLGVALVGNEHSYSRMVARGRAVHYGQIRSRLGMVVALDKPGRGDVGALCARYGLEDEETLDLLTAAAQHHGTLRNVAKALLQASSNHHRATPARVQAALRNLRLDREVVR